MRSTGPAGTSAPDAGPGTGSPPVRPLFPPGSRFWSWVGASTRGRSTTGLRCGPPAATVVPAVPPPVRPPVLPGPPPVSAGRGASCSPVRKHPWEPAWHASPGPGARERLPPPGAGRVYRRSGLESAVPPRPAAAPGLPAGPPEGSVVYPTPR